MLTDFLDRDLIYERFIVLFKKNPRPVYPLSEDIGISHLTLNRFIRKKGRPDMQTLIHIQNWLEKNEDKQPMVTLHECSVHCCKSK